jgi:hypothetical protein
MGSEFDRSGQTPASVQLSSVLERFQMEARGAGQFLEGPGAAQAPRAGDDGFDLEALKWGGGTDLVFEFFG